MRASISSMVPRPAVKAAAERFARLAAAEFDDFAGPGCRFRRRRRARRRWGAAERPRISTGVEGPADFTALPLSSCMARTRPHSAPATTMSPGCRVPFWTSTVATGPRPLSRRDSMIAPSRRYGRGWRAVRVVRPAGGWLPRACRGRFFFRAETSTSWVSPPISSTTTSCCRSSWRTRLGSAPGRSILLTATINGDAGGFGVPDRLDGLRHDAVIGGDDQNHNVCNAGAAGAHGGEGFVARCVEEG